MTNSAAEPAPRQVSLPNETATIACGRWVGTQVQPGDVILLIGDLGLGKTTWMRGLAATVGVAPEDIRSPTFALIMEHERSGGVGTLLHADLYRAEAHDLDALGLLESLGAPDVIAAIEWPEALQSQLRGVPVWTLRWRHAPDATSGGRLLEITPPTGRNLTDWKVPTALSQNLPR